MTEAIGTLTKILPLEVSSDDPLGRDALNRKEPCEGLANFIENSTTPYTLAINASPLVCSSAQGAPYLGKQLFRQGAGFDYFPDTHAQQFFSIIIGDHAAADNRHLQLI